MTYKIEYTTAARRNLRKLTQSIRKRIVKRIESLTKNPRPSGVIRLEGDDDVWRIRVGDYRILYTIEDKVLVVTVVRVGDRKEVYRR